MHWLEDLILFGHNDEEYLQEKRPLNWLFNKRDFSVETTLAGGNTIRLIRNAKENGFEITMFYVGLGDYELNIERVAARVRNGGHDIPTEDIIRRHHTSIKNLLTYLELLDHLIVIDNSQTKGQIALVVKRGSIVNRADSLPSWVSTIEQSYINREENKRFE